MARTTTGRTGAQATASTGADARAEGRGAWVFDWPGKEAAEARAQRPASPGGLRPMPEHSVNWAETQNIFVEGDNLEALKLLKPGCAGRVRIIYIDPPYNTGNDFVYDDRLSRTEWLGMMYPRLLLAREFLTRDGVIMISIDDREQPALRMLCDDVFGAGNFVANLVWKKKYTGGKHTKGFVSLHEYILVYARDRTALPELFVPRPSEETCKFREEDEFLAERGRFYTRPLKSNLALRRTLIYPVTAPDGSTVECQWLVAKDTLARLMEEQRVVFRRKRDGTYQLYRKYYENDAGGRVKPPSIIDRFPNTEGKAELRALFDIGEGRDNVFYTVKPLGLIKHLIAPFDARDALVMDFFAGSGTTAQAVMELNADGGARRFIAVQLPVPLEDGPFGTIAGLARERLRRAGAKLAGLSGYSGDIGFRAYKAGEDAE